MTEGELIKAMKRAWLMLAKEQEREEPMWIVQNPSLADRVEVLKAWRRRK